MVGIRTALPSMTTPGAMLGMSLQTTTMESVQDMSGCKDNQKVKYIAGSFVGRLTLTREEICPCNEMQKLETELWNHAMVGAGHATYTDRYVYGIAPQIRGMVEAIEPKTIQKVVQIAGTLINEALRNGSIKKNPEKRGNVREPSKDRNVRDDNKRTRTGNALATTTNSVGRENAGMVPKCTTCNSYHAPGAPCHTCFNCNRPGHFAKDCRVVSMNVNPVNVRNPIVARRACFKCGSPDHYKSACPRLIKAQGPGGNRPNQALANDEVRVVGTMGIRQGGGNSYWEQRKLARTRTS
ncbi:reverse transcriptase domain-containing protein [Tanacetum coccineum]